MIQEEKVHSIKDIDSLLTFLREELNWQLPEGDISDITFDWTGTELNLSESIHQKLKDGRIRQLQNFRTDQPWGIFVVDFDTDKFLVTPIRNMLRCLVSKKRGQSPEHTSWDLPNLLFICLYGEDGFTFAHFKGDKPFGSPLTTFSWHPGEPIRTVCEYNFPALEYDDNWTPDKWTSEWQKAFDVEKVNKLFYQEIAELYYRLTGKNKHTRELEFPSQGEKPEDKDYEEFAVRLIGRTIFCWFLKHKKSPPPHPVPLIPSEILSLQAVNNNPSYYHSVLEPLFFELMNKEKSARPPLMLTKSDTVPFLNGGLFESHPNDFYSGTPAYSLKVPDQWFIDFFTVLEKYNFTIDENSSINIDVSVDPEMLGRVFENLLAEVVPETGETARKATGSYYTPRVIVDYMVEQSLKQYLLTKTNLDEVKIYALLAYGEDVVSFTQQQKKAVIEALTEIKIIDPACGSGAFPMGILHRMLMAMAKVDPKLEIWRRQYLDGLDPMVRQTVEKNIRKSNWAYIRKLMIIRDAIYGVDIQPIAVEIAKLRCFLSLVVDEIVTDGESNRGIESLPNLEFKFVAANTLIGLPPKIERQGKFGISQHIKTLKLLRDEYLRSSGTGKKEIEKKFRQTQKKLQEENAWLLTDKEAILLAEWDPFSYHSSAWFDPEWMFGVNHGFDIVIGNPPYIQLQKESGKLADLYKNSGYKTFERTGDIYALFYERGINILTKQGHLCFITSNKWMRTGYGESLRDYFLTKNPILLIDLGPGVFENATVDTNILIIQNTQNKNRLLGLILTTEANDKDLTEYVNSNAVKLPSMTKNAWFIGNDAEQKLKEKIESKGKPLKDWEVSIYRGVLTGLNEAFIIDTATKEQLCKEDPKSLEILKPILRGKDIKRYAYEWAGLWLIASGFDVNVPKLYPSIYQYLKQWEVQAKNRDDQGQNWWNLRACTYYSEFVKEKVVWKALSLEPAFCYGDRQYFNNDKANILTSKNNDLKYLIGYLNSRLFQFSFSKIGVNMGHGFEYKIQFIAEICVPPVTSKNQHIVNKIEELVTQIIATKKQNSKASTSTLERKIDQLVYQLYELTPDEIVVVEGKA